MEDGDTEVRPQAEPLDEKRPPMKVLGYGSKSSLLARFAADRNVLHLGAVGEAHGTAEARVRAAMSSVHADLTKVARTCVGVDIDRVSVAALSERGIFSNLVVADATQLTPGDINLSPIDVIIASDIIEHLPRPADLLTCALQLADSETLLVVTTTNALGLLLFARNTLGRPIEGWDHVCSFNLATLGNMLVRTGWCPLEAYTCHQKLAATSRSFKVGRLLFKLVPRWGGTLLVTAKPAR